MATKKAVAATATIAAVGLATWLGASVMAGRAAADEIGTLARSPGGHGLQVLALKPEPGLLSSVGTMALRVEDSCGDSRSDEALTLQLQYQLSHLILPGSLLRLSWSLQPTGAAGAAFTKAFGSQAALQGEGDVSFGRELRSSLSLPALSVSEGGRQVRIEPSQGRLRWGAESFGLDWKTGALVARGGGDALELRGIGLEMDIRNRRLGTGTVAFEIGQIATGTGSAEGLRLAAEAVERGDRIDVSVKPSLKRLQAGGQEARDLTLELALRNLHTASLETVNRIVTASCGLQNLTAPESQQLRQAVGTLVAQGLSLAIPRLAGTVGPGSLDGQMTLELKPSGTGKPVALAQLLRSSGHLLLKGAGLTDDQKRLVLAMGLAREMPEGLRADFAYADGVLKANGRVFDAGGVQTALAAADEQLNGWLVAFTRVAAAQPTAEAAAAPAAPVQAPADESSAARPAPAADAAPTSTPAPDPASAAGR